jgi:hypothetical protein
LSPKDYRTERAQGAVGFLGFGLAAFRQSAIGQRWLTGAGSYRMASYRAIQARPGKTGQPRKG